MTGNGWREFPKIELHLHLEGAAPPNLTRKIAIEKGVSVDGLFDANGTYAWSDFTEFLETYDAVAALYKGPDEAARLTQDVLREASSNGLIYQELFLSPDHASPGELADQGAWGEYLLAVSEAAARVEAETGIVARFIPLCVRGLGPERALRAAEVVANAPHPRVVGWGMAGDERMFRVAEFAPAFQIAAEAGLHLTAHAGEFCGPESVRAVLDELKVSRVGHGVRAVEDPAMVSRLADEGVTLEVNPGSNVSLRVYRDWASHPLPMLREAGVRVTISTDDPPFFGTDMTREFDMAEKRFGFSKAEFREITLNALDATFCDPATREALRARLGF